MSKKPKEKVCERCGKKFMASSGYVHFCDECSEIVKQEKRNRNNQSRLIVKQNKLLKGVEGVDYVIDLWNGLPTTRITGRWFNERHPGRTIEEYLAEFPNAQLVCKKTSNKISENTKEFMNKPEMKRHFSEMFSGDKNPNSKKNTTLEQRQRISPFSKSFKGYDELSDEEKESIIRNRLQSDRNDRTTSQIEYWIKKGYSKEDAKMRVSERQKTFTLEKCIEKYGEEDGLKRWQERQLKWCKSLINSFEKDGDNRTPISKFEKDCKETICNLLNIDIPSKQKYMSDKSGNHYSYDLTINHKIIEFNGDYWHMNPDIYSKDDYNKSKKMTSLEIWNHDEEKIKCANSNGYEVLTIWESEYNKDKEGTIRKCIDFLTNTEL